MMLHSHLCKFFLHNVILRHLMEDSLLQTEFLCLLINSLIVFWNLMVLENLWSLLIITEICGIPRNILLSSEPFGFWVFYFEMSQPNFATKLPSFCLAKFFSLANSYQLAWGLIRNMKFSVVFNIVGRYRVIIIKVPFWKCYKKSTTSQNDFKFGLNILEKGEFDMG